MPRVEKVDVYLVGYGGERERGKGKREKSRERGRKRKRSREIEGGRGEVGRRERGRNCLFRREMESKEVSGWKRKEDQLASVDMGGMGGA